MADCQKLLREVYNRAHILIPESLKEDVKLALSTDTITIPREEYEALLDDQLKLMALEDAGVDNWGYYGEAMEQYRQWRDSDR